MKPINLILVLLLTILYLALLACNKKPDQGPEGAAKLERLARIKTGNLFTTFTYAPDGKLIEIRDSQAGGHYPAARTRFEYSNGRISKVFFGFLTFTYEYPGNNTVIVHAGSLSDPQLTREIFYYNGNQLSEYVRCDARTLEPEQKNVFTYDTSGNLVRQEEYVYDHVDTHQWKKTATGVTTYDSRQNLLAPLEWRQFCFIERHGSIVKNNPLKTEWFNGAGQPLRTHHYQYEYDSMGRVIRRVEELVANHQVTNREVSFFTYE